MRQTAKGFTLIELLIVIAVLGILAVAVLSAINPIEQIDRGKDTASRSDAEQILGGMERFYTNNGYYVWRPDTSLGTDALAWTKVTNAWNDGTTAVLTKLSAGVVGVSTGELKTSFVTRVVGAKYNPLWVYNKGAQGDSTYVCFKPLSAALSTEATTRCAAKPADYPASACANTTNCGTAGNCICLP